MKKYLIVVLIIMGLFLLGCNVKEEKKYQITFYDINEDVLIRYELPLNANINEPTIPNVTGYHFVGWDPSVPENVIEDIDIFAQYEINTYHISFLNEDNTIYQEYDLKYNEEIVYPLTNPTKEHYDFVSWDNSIDLVTSDLVFKPIFIKKSYNVTFLDENDNVISENEYPYLSELVYPSFNPTKEHYNFVGWDNLDNVVKGDLVIKPLFEKVNYHCKFMVDDTIIYECDIPYGSEAICDNNLIPNKPGYKFVSWDNDPANISSDMIFNAVYEEINYNVSFYDMYGKLISTEIVKAGADAIAPIAPSVPYHDFTGWNVDFSNVSCDLNVRATYKAQQTVFSKETANYWIKVTANNYDVLEVILTKEEINQVNQDIFNNYSKTKVIDLTKVNETISGATVKSYINSYTNLTKYSVYNESGVSVGTTDIANNRNLDNIPSTVNVKFGIVTDFARLRSYPTNCYSSSDKTDYFQETSLNVGEGVAIYHESSDGLWYFVDAQNYRGWVEKKNIAICTRQEMIDFLTCEDFVVVTANYLTIDNHHVRMGQRFPVKVNGSTYEMSYPTRLSNGNLSFVNKNIELGDDYHLGYLDYTLENIYIQAFKMLGIDYSWGDKKESGRDCSSTQNAIYTCFGFKMPRNTSNQRSIPNYSKSVSGVTSSLMKTTYRPGTLIFSSGHVMMYIGTDESGTAYLFHNTSAGSSKCILQGLDSYGGSKIIGLLYLYKK